MHTQSIMGKRATAQQLDPATSSAFDVCCAEVGLPKPSSGRFTESYSYLDLAAAKLGKPGERISIVEAEREFGENWPSAICR